NIVSERKYYDSRIKKIFTRRNNQKTANLILLKDENIYYLTGFYGKDSGSLLLIVDDDIHLLVNFIYLEQARKSVKNKNLNIACYKKNKFRELAKILEDYSSRSIGVEGKNINFTGFRKLEKLLSVNGKRLVSIDGVGENLRTVKDRVEISKIKNACKITDKVFGSIINSGAASINKLSEIELACRIEELLVKSNSEGRSFDTIVAYDKNSSMPHYSPQKIKVKGGLILMDFGCKFENYCSDMTRTIFTKNQKICNEFKKIYDIVLKAQLLAIENCREGVTCSQLDRIARKFIISKGYGNNFGHRLGHGVGIEVHEEPAVTMENRTVLRENMVITIEPGIYIENFGGVRIEDMVIVGKNGCEVLYNSKKSFFILK
ncbi:MAG: aminopeptidase P family protein, partial [Actinobacteria bacterium]|nr:aminopeptidase P family protein [Actinomycetota bacterium]